MWWLSSKAGIQDYSLARWETGYLIFVLAMCYLTIFDRLNPPSSNMWSCRRCLYKYRNFPVPLNYNSRQWLNTIQWLPARFWNRAIEIHIPLLLIMSMICITINYHRAGLKAPPYIGPFHHVHVHVWSWICDEYFRYNWLILNEFESEHLKEHRLLFHVVHIPTQHRGREWRLYRKWQSWLYSSLGSATRRSFWH